MKNANNTRSKELDYQSLSQFYRELKHVRKNSVGQRV